ncbi:MAG: YlbF family regulator [Ruminococcaceae bacterium]|nr:YlbF family regulator [Oscillospiraceae bacterium]
MEKTIFELAAELGRTLKEDERIIALDKARAAFDADATVVALMQEYEVQQRAIQEEAVKEDRSEEVLNVIQDRIETIYNQITESESYKRLEQAQNEVNALMEAVNNTITFNITGEEPSACTHDCSTCGGCH